MTEQNLYTRNYSIREIVTTTMNYPQGCEGGKTQFLSEAFGVDSDDIGELWERYYSVTLRAKWITVRGGMIEADADNQASYLSQIWQEVADEMEVDYPSETEYSDGWFTAQIPLNDDELQDLRNNFDQGSFAKVFERSIEYSSQPGWIYVQLYRTDHAIQS